jgi:CheY-like chemotaxis protein
MDRIRFESKVDCSFDRIGEIRRLIGTVSMAAGAPVSIQNRLTTCFSEAASNIAQHTLPPAETLYVQLGQSSREWWIAITDDGGRSDAIVQREPAAAAEHGRGLLIIESMADEFSVIQIEDNRYRTTIRVERADGDSLPCVLVVEDDLALRRLYQGYLEKHFDVVSAENGTEALETLKKQPVDIVLSDIHMPGVDGFALRQALLADPDKELVPFLFLTGANDADTLAMAHQMIVDDCLRKPVAKQQLIDAVERVLLRKQQFRQRLSSRLVTRIDALQLGDIGNETVAGEWRVVSRSRSSGEGGGDFVIEHQTDDARTIVFADVMGHDAEAKFFAFGYAGFLRGMFAATTEALPPDVVMAELSNAINRNSLLQASMLTCCILVLRQGRSVQFCSAGHPPLLRINDSGIEPLSTGGILPGLIDCPVYQASTLHLSPGERLAVFSDGLLDSGATVSQRERLEEAIMKQLQSSSRLDLADAVNITLRRFDEFATPSCRDDATLLMIEPMNTIEPESLRC